MYRRGQGNGSRGLAAGALFLIALFGTRDLLGVLRRVAVLRRVLWRGEVGFLSLPAVDGAFLACAGVFLGCLTGIWFVVNHRRLVDFLIETEEEMRRVSWPWDRTAKGVFWGIFPNKGRELIQSSAAVVVSVVLLGLILWVYDLTLKFGLERLVTSAAKG
jgi:preprotein translocase subunit SecE